MGWEVEPLALAAALCVSGALAAVAAYLSWQERPKVGAPTIAVHALFYVAWALSQAVMVTTSSKVVALGALVVTGAVIAGAALTWFVFAFQFTGRGEWLTRRRLVALSVEPLAFTALTLANQPFGPHEQVVVDARMVDGAGVASLQFEWGWLVWFHAAYLGLVASVGVWVLHSKFLASRNVYRTRTFVFLAGGVGLITTTLLDLTGLSPTPYFTLTPLAFLVVGAVGIVTITSVRALRVVPLDRVLSFLSGRSKNLRPVARDTIIEEMETGVLVLDHAGRIVDINPNGRAILASSETRVVGRRLADVVDPTLNEVESPIGHGEIVPGEYTGIWIGAEEDRCVDLKCRMLDAPDQWPAGYVILVHDVTERERRKEQLTRRTDELERRNEQLDDFANVVTPDLRNPLSVAVGHLDLAEETGESDHFDSVRSAHDRMRAIIDDVLAMARQTKALDETEPVELAGVAHRAWDHVDSSEATLETDVDIVVEGDPGRLSQLFENLYRNAIDHGGPAVTVRVETIADGFAVEDDGKGIPTGQRRAIFERGYTTSDGGTGFGLSIVESIVQAHGWDIDVTDGRTGGARFEITAIEVVDETHATDH